MILKDLGEFRIIDRISGLVRPLSGRVIKGIGADAAVLKYKNDKRLLFTTDMLVEGRHFFKAQGGYLIGRKSMEVNVSDIAAMGGMPLCAVVSLGVPPSLNVNFVDALYRGIMDAAAGFGIDVVGGDTVNSGKIIVNIALIGETENKNLVLRSGARPGDEIFLTGDIGGSIKGKHLDFTPRVKEARFLVKNYRIHSMIDISDGLIADLGHILEESRVGAVIHEKDIPLSKHAVDFDLAVMDGEDFELVFTVSEKQARDLMKKWPFRTRISRIGKICSAAKGLYLVRENNKKQKIKPKGYTHF